MLKLLNRRIDVGFITNPFYLYCITFMLTAFLYFWGWSDLFPDLSSGLFAFLVCSFLVFVLLGKEFWKSSSSASDQPELNSSVNDILFWIIILMGLLNVILMGYLPVLNRGIDYRDFGTPVLDPLPRPIRLIPALCRPVPDRNASLWSP